MTFDDFVRDAEPKLRHALVAAYGLDAGVDAAAEAIAYAFEHWAEVAEMYNPTGYLYRVGQTAARRNRRTPPRMPPVDASRLPSVEPGLVPALEQLSDQQRTVVVLVEGLQWRQSEVAEMLDISHATVRTHLQRALTTLRSELMGEQHAND